MVHLLNVRWISCRDASFEQSGRLPLAVVQQLPCEGEEEEPATARRRRGAGEGKSPSISPFFAYSALAFFWGRRFFLPARWIMAKVWTGESWAKRAGPQPSGDGLGGPLFSALFCFIGPHISQPSSSFGPSMPTSAALPSACGCETLFPPLAPAAAMDGGDLSTSLALAPVEAAPQIPTKKKKPANPPKRFVHTPIPPSILSDPALAAASTSLLPANYNFELHKTAHRIRSAGARRVALQLPEGLLLFSLPLSHILAPYLQPDPANDVLVLADATYGACCLADRPAKALEADVLVHYGHSCLVPVTSSLLPVLYVFVEIHVDATRLAAAVRSAFPDPDAAPRLAIAGTVQFISAVHAAREMLTKEGYRDIVVPQAKPLSAGEILGCTAPALKKSEGVGAVVFVADGRFHLEAFMIANPGVKAYRFDPFLGVLVLEEYDHVGMKQARKAAVLAAREARSWGVVLGTLGRQGSVKVLDRVVEHLEEKGLDHTVVLMSELSPARMELFGDSVDAWVQIACPRLSIDWGEGFKKPVLTTFEFDVALGYVPGWWEKGSTECGINGDTGCSGSETCGTGDCSSADCSAGEFGGEYPMDYYSQDGGDWNSCYMKKASTCVRKPRARLGNGVQVEKH